MRNQHLLKNINLILTKLGIRFNKVGNRISFTCPIHGSDNHNSLTIYKNTGIWRCWTKHCEKEIGQTLDNLINRLVQIKCGKTPDWYEKILQDRLKPNVDEDDVDFIYKTHRLNGKNKSKNNNVSIDTIKSSLEIPSKYFLARGFSPSVLFQYYVGECHKPDKPMFERAVVPVIHNDTFVGCLGRTVNGNIKKWKNSFDFSSGRYLYNFDRAKKHDTIIIVEGCGDVWRLVEAGYNNCVSIFGANFTNYQKKLIDSTGATNIIIATDNDDAGLDVARRIYTQCSRSYNCTRLEYEGKDLGSLSIEEVKRVLCKVKF